MKTMMRGYLGVTAVLALAGAVMLTATPARADGGGASVGLTNQLVAGTASTIPVFKIDKQDNCGFQLSFQGTNSNAANITCALFRSGDNVTFETSAGIVFGIAANGTTAVCLYTNIGATYIGAATYFKGYVTNAGGADLTNSVLQVVRKTIKPSP